MFHESLCVKWLINTDNLESQAGYHAVDIGNQRDK
jgi:hypothetical protein